MIKSELKSSLFLICMICACLAGLTPRPACASVSFQLKGKLSSFDETSVKIATTQFIYVLKKSALTPEQREDIKKKHSGDDVTLLVSNSSIDSSIDSVLDQPHSAQDSSAQHGNGISPTPKSKK